MSAIYILGFSFASFSFHNGEDAIIKIKKLPVGELKKCGESICQSEGVVTKNKQILAPH